MNLWLRVLSLILSAFWRPRLNPVSDTSRLTFRVWPHDLDTSLHMNNGRYWTLMDLGRTDIMIRSGLWRTILNQGWVPMVGAGQIRFRRELKPFRTFTLETRILTWLEGQAVIEHRLVSQAKDGGTLLHAIALVKVGVYDRKERRFVPISRLMGEIGLKAEAPWVAPEVEAFLRAEETLKSAA
jgi:acyl-CoA thioesterase FadM